MENSEFKCRYCNQLLIDELNFFSHISFISEYKCEKCNVIFNLNLNTNKLLSEVFFTKFTSLSEGGKPKNNYIVNQIFSGKILLVINDIDNWYTNNKDSFFINSDIKITPKNVDSIFKLAKCYH